MDVVYYNSEFIKAEDLIIKSSNRAFSYGDGFFETIKVINGFPFNFSAHYNRFSFACSVLKLKNIETERSLLALVLKLIQKNKLINGSVKLHISRREGGKYLPNSSSVNILISSSDGEVFINNKPVSLCIFKDEYKAKGKLSNLKSINSLVSVLGAIYAKEKRFDNSILKNSDDAFIETTNSNIFILKEEKIYTPPLSDGCVAGTMREWVMKIENVIEKSLNQIDIETADEVFITNALLGITSVKEIFLESTTYEYKAKKSSELQQTLINSSLDL